MGKRKYTLRYWMYKDDCSFNTIIVEADNEYHAIGRALRHVFPNILKIVTPYKVEVISVTLARGKQKTFKHILTWKSDVDRKIFKSTVKQNKDETYYFRVSNVTEEGCSNGYVKLTVAQAEAIAYALDPKNWILSDVETYVPSFSINLEDRKTVDEIESYNEKIS